MTIASVAGLIAVCSMSPDHRIFRRDFFRFRFSCKVQDQLTWSDYTGKRPRNAGISQSAVAVFDGRRTQPLPVPALSY